MFDSVCRWLDFNCSFAFFSLSLSVVLLTRLYTYITCEYYAGKVKMEGKTVIVTGATSGIGKETATELARRGAKVIVACRNPQTGAVVRDEIIESTKNQNVFIQRLDLSSQKSIRQFAKSILQTENRLDVLIHNAGTGESKFKLTEDKIEITMATNHFGPFLLTHLLIDLLKQSAPSRIVVVASELYRFASLNLNKINPQSHWFPAYLYYVSKYANICFTRALAKRLDGTGVTANCLHPGMVDSGIWRNVPVPFNWPLKLLVKCFFKTPVQGCQTSVYLACSDEVEAVTGRYFMDCKEHGLSPGCRGDNRANKLWEISEGISGLQPTDPSI